LLDAASNNTSSLTWLPGNPMVMNTSVDFDISKPNVLNLDCCKADLYFCIKVSVKDVNCNVCEKVICVEKKPEPCEISIAALNQSYCTKDTMHISWSNIQTTGLVNVYLVPASGGTSMLIASNQLSSGTIDYTIPASFTPCGQKWKVVVKSVDNEECMDTSKLFVIKCCEVACDCQGWKSNKISIVKKFVVIPHTGGISSSMKKSQLKDGLKTYTTCGSTVPLALGQTYEFTSPEFNCNPDNESCQPIYNWHVQNSAGQDEWKVGKKVGFLFNQPGSYFVDISPTCSGNNCETCRITVVVEGSSGGNGVGSVESHLIRKK